MGRRLAFRVAPPPAPPRHPWRGWALLGDAAGLAAVMGALFFLAGFVL